MTLRTSSLALTLALVATTSLASAADMTMHDKSYVMSKLDTSGHDGTLDMSEVMQAANAKFAELDTDHEGTLDASELSGIMTPAELAAADTDHDGTLSKAEYDAYVKKMFVAANPDNDGTLSEAELSTRRGIALVALLDY